jgi:hypothetical protein
VRFFGAPYERSTIEEAFIKPIETPLSKLSLKRSAKLTNALSEMEKHMKLLKQPLSSDVPVAAKAAKTKSVSDGPPKKRIKVVCTLKLWQDQLTHSLLDFQEANHFQD